MSSIPGHGPATEKARRPYVRNRCRGRTRSRRLADLRCCREATSETGRQRSIKYCGTTTQCSSIYLFATEDTHAALQDSPHQSTFSGFITLYRPKFIYEMGSATATPCSAKRGALSLCQQRHQNTIIYTNSVTLRVHRCNVNTQHESVTHSHYGYTYTCIVNHKKVAVH